MLNKKVRHENTAFMTACMFIPQYKREARASAYTFHAENMLLFIALDYTYVWKH